MCIRDRLDIAWADRLSAALERLSVGGIDAVLLDLSLPDSFGMDTLERILRSHPGIPVIVFTGRDDERVAASNRRALSEISCRKELRLLPANTHSPDSAAAFELVARETARWFVQRLPGA